jgi:O-antigen ligase
VLALLVFAALSLVFPDLLSYYVGRFIKGDITTGRLDLMQLYHEYIMENPIVFAFGIGLQDFSLRLVEIYRIAFNAPHNVIQELIVAWGIPGIFLFTAMIFCMYRVSGRLWTRKKLLNSIPLLIVLLKGLAGQMITSAYTMLALSYAYLSLSTALTPTEDT